MEKTQKSRQLLKVVVQQFVVYRWK